jgi:hypothetical protein
LPESTRVAHHPVTIPQLPDGLEAFPVYRERTRDDGEKVNSTLLRLEIRAASRSTSATWPSRLTALDGKTREWLTKNRSGLAKTITRRFGEQTMGLLYRWCADGIVIFSVKPPSGPDAPHGSLVNWRLTQPVLAFVQDAERSAAAQQADQQDEARNLAERLSTIPEGHGLSRILLDITDREYLPHAIASARAVVIDARATKTHRKHDTTPESWRIIRQLARGYPKDYSLDRERVAGGQAYVYTARHKATGTLVAYKRLRIRDTDSIARMRREIEAGKLFGHHPNVMPVLDADLESCWFVMPLASGTARAKAADLQAPVRLRELLAAACEALRAPHEKGWIHRDLKPDNLLMVDNCWAVADWGLARRPRGTTSEPGRTRTGTGYGTEGFAAPELSLDAHRVGPQADIYSLGQIIGSILTGRSPQANLPLIPPREPWADIVSRATQRDPAERPQNVDEFLGLIDACSRTNHRSM